MGKAADGANMTNRDSSMALVIQEEKNKEL